MREVHEYENSSVCEVVRFDPRNKVLLRAELVSDWSCTLLLESNREQARASRACTKALAMKSTANQHKEHPKIVSLGAVTVV